MGVGQINKTKYKHLNIINYVKVRQLSWSGHTNRTPETSIVKRIHKWKPFTGGGRRRKEQEEEKEKRRRKKRKKKKKKKKKSKHKFMLVLVVSTFFQSSIQIMASKFLTCPH